MMTEMTCETYVLNRITKLETEMEDKEMALAVLQSKLDSYEKLFDELSKRLSVKQYQKSNYIDFSTVWDTDDKLFNMLIDTFNLRDRLDKLNASDGDDDEIKVF